MNKVLLPQDQQRALIRDGLKIGRYWVPCIALLLFVEGLSHLQSQDPWRIGLPWVSSIIVGIIAVVFWQAPARVKPLAVWTLVVWSLPMVNIVAHVEQAPVLALVFSTMVLLLASSLITQGSAILVALPATAAVQLISVASARPELPGAELVPAFSIPLAVITYWGRRRLILEHASRRALDVVLQEQQAQLDRLDTLQRVSGQVAHHINNKLVGVVAGTSTALTLLEADHPARRWLDIANDSAERVASMSKKLAGQTSSVVTVAEHISLGSLLDVDYLHSRLPHSARLKISIAEPSEAIVGNRAQLQEAVIAVLENASETMAEGGSIAIHAGRDDAGGGSLIEISDTGEGIEAQLMRRVVEPFFTTRGPSRTGLGLSFATDAMRNHGGSLQIQSETGEGTTVILRFPAVSATSLA